MKELFSQVLNMSMTASVMIVLVILARLALKRAPKIYSYVLWSVVLVRLLCPVSLPSPVSLLGMLDAPVAENVGLTTSVAYIQPETAFRMGLPSEQAESQVQPEAEVSEPLETNKVDRKDTISLPDVLAVVWLTGAVCLYLLCVGNYLRFRRKLRCAWKLDSNVYLLDHIDTAFAAGFFSPKIYLPSDLPKDQTAYIVAHERCHIRRLDPLTRLLAFTAVCLHWFNPLVWLAFVLSGKDMEMSCDEAVIRQLGPGIRSAYSQSLLNLAAGSHLFPGAPLAFGEGDTGSRIRNLAAWRKPRIGGSILCLVLSLAILAACGLNPEHPTADSPATVSNPLPEWTEEEAMARCQEVLEQVQSSEGYQILIYQENLGDLALNETSMGSFWKSGDNWLSMYRIPTEPPHSIFAYLHWDGVYWDNETTGGFDENGCILWESWKTEEVPEPWLAAFQWSDEKISQLSMEDTSQQRIVRLTVSEPYVEGEWITEAGYSVDFVFNRDSTFSHVITHTQNFSEQEGEFGYNRTMYIQTLDTSAVTADIEAYRDGKKPAMTRIQPEELAHAKASIGKDITEFTNMDGSASFQIADALPDPPEGKILTATPRLVTEDEVKEIEKRLFPEEAQTEIYVSADQFSIYLSGSQPLQWEVPTQEQIAAAKADAQNILDSIGIGQWRVTSAEVIQYGSENAPEYGILVQAAQMLQELELTVEENWSLGATDTNAWLRFTPDGTLVDIGCWSPLQVTEESSVEILDPDTLLEKAKSVLASYPAIQTFGKPAEYTVEITDIVWGSTLTGVDAQTGAYRYVPSLIFRGEIQFQSPEGQYLFSQVLGTKNRLILNALDGSILYTGLPE